MDRRSYLAAAGTVVAGGLAGCIGSGQGEAYDVDMTTSDFRPEVLEVPPGTTVTWGNSSGTGHTVTAYENGIPDDAEYFASGGFDTESGARSAWQDGFGGALYSGDTYESTFEVPGEHRYVCIPHEQRGMIGVVVVRESATPPG